VEPLIQVIVDKEEDVRRQAVEALGEIGDSRAVEPLLLALGMKSKWSVQTPFTAGLSKVTAELENMALKMTIISALVKIGKPSVEPLIEALADENSEVRRYAANTLGKIKDDRAIVPLIHALRDKNWIVRNWVADALEEIGEPAVVYLTHALGDEDKDMQKAAKKVLEKIQKKLKKNKK
jgi:HEAT repeat protein